MDHGNDRPLAKRAGAFAASLVAVTGEEADEDRFQKAVKLAQARHGYPQWHELSPKQRSAEIYVQLRRLDALASARAKAETSRSRPITLNDVKKRRLIG